MVLWHALGYCTPDIIYQLRRACGSPWTAYLSKAPLSVAPLTAAAIAAFTAWFEGTGQLRVGEHHHPSPQLRHLEMAPVWFAGDVRQIPALLALRNRLLNPNLYP